MKTCPKKPKKYSYTKDCKEQPREISDLYQKKTVQPVCKIRKGWSVPTSLKRPAGTRRADEERRGII